ncbi:MAG: LysM peptidoglycan-binding domain-containing protein [bacterium]|nr:LysM peptidoglycan-binding domain-containing protein [bacterium]
MIILLIYLLNSFSAPIYGTARVKALGSAFTGLADDINALFYNPAGLYTIDYNQLAFQAGRLLSLHKSESNFTLAYAMKLPRTTVERYLPKFPIKDLYWGVGYYGFYSQSKYKATDINLTTLASKAGEGYEVLKKFPIPFEFGVGLRLVFRDYEEPPKQNVFSPALNLGVLTHFYDNKLNIGLALLGIPGGAVFREGMQFRFGVCYKRPEGNYMIDYLFDERVSRFYPAAEFIIQRDILRVRVGKFRAIDGSEAIMTGLGINLLPFLLDLNLQFPQAGFLDPTGGFHISGVYKFGAPPYPQYIYGVGLEAVTKLENRKKELEDEIKKLNKEIMDLNDRLNIAREDVRQAEVLSIQSKSRIEELMNKQREAENSLRETEKKMLEKQLELKMLEEKIGELKKQATPRPLQTAPPRPQGPRTHVVKAGESLRDIALRYYGDPQKWITIFNANKDKIERGIPKPGSVLVIP